MTRRTGSVLRTALLASLVVVLAAPVVDARPGGGRSSGSRGSQTYSAPPSTATAPSAAQPIQRSQTSPSYGAPATASVAGAPSRGFGFGGGFLAGMLGAGLLGAMLGHGFMGGLGGIASFLGLLLQVALIGGLIFLAVRFFRRRQEPAPAGAGAPYARSTLSDAVGGGAAQARPASAAQGGPPVTRQPLEIVREDYAAFERLLCETQLAYGREDVAALHRLATPEMVGYFEEDLTASRTRGVRNEVTRPRLLQGDLAEAWREHGVDYATVAMRFEIVDATVDRASGQVVGGDLSRPTEATEIWTFRRQGAGSWMLSAIQQTA